MQEPDRQRRAVTADEIDIDNFGTDFAVAATSHQQAGAITANEVRHLDIAGLERCQVVPEPVGKRRVEVLHPPLGVRRENSGRRVVEIVDGALQF